MLLTILLQVAAELSLGKLGAALGAGLAAIGAGIGGNLSMRYGIRMIWVSVGCLLVSFFMMFSERVK